MDIHARLLTLLHILCFWEDYVDGKDKVYREPEASRLASFIISQSSVRQLVIVLDNLKDVDLRLPVLMSEENIIQVTYMSKTDFRVTTQRLMRTLLERQNIDSLCHNLNFLVVCSGICINSIVKTAHLLEISDGKRCLLRHFSRWILIPTDGTFESVPISTIQFDNVNIIIKNLNFTNKEEDFKDHLVFTLLWGDQGRYWSPIDEEYMSTYTPFPNSMQGLNGRTLLVASLEYLPYTKKEVINGKIVYTGVSEEIFRRLADVFNFSVQFVEPEDGVWGEAVNSTWTGIVGMLQREEVDMSGVPYAETLERQTVMSFTYPVTNAYQSAIYKKHEDPKAQWTSLTSCFKWQVYLCGLFTIFGVCVLFVFLQKFSPNPRPPTDRERELSVPEIIMLGVAVPLHQGSTMEPKTAPCKVLLSFWWLFCIIVTSVYTGNLTAFITVSKEYTPFQTLDEVAQHTEYDVGVMSGDVIELNLQISDEYRSVWNKIQVSKRPDKVSSEEEAEYHLSRLQAGGYVWLMDQTAIDQMIAKRCDITKLQQSFMHMYAAFTFPKQSPLAVYFSNQLMYLTENGLITSWMNRYSPKAKRCPTRRVEDTIRLELGDLLSCIVACVSGITVAFLALTGELLLRHAKHEMQKRILRPDHP